MMQPTDTHTFESKVFKAGKVVNVTRIKVSPDGKALTLHERGTSPGGAPSRGMRTYDRQ